MFVLFIPQCGHSQKCQLGEQIEPANGEAKRLVFDVKNGPKEI